MKDILHIFFSNNPDLIKTKAVIDNIATADISVLIKGESGTGKELVARTIHLNSNRYDKPFIKVNCAAVPRGLLESELFGFEKGAFTGAHLKKPGKFELANDGTILLNDVGEMDVSVQGKLLQVLQDGEFARLGGDQNIRVNTRVITTTQDHLERSIQEGRFRADLFYRLNAITIAVPPLRERREQIIPLSQYYFDLYRTKYGRSVPPVSLKAAALFKSYRWPGNIRELENIVKRIVLFGEESVVQDLGREKPKACEEVVPQAPSPQPIKQPRFINLKKVGKKAAEIAERKMIQTALQETHWNRKVAAKLLGISYKALLIKIQKYRLGELQSLERSQGANDERLRN